MFILPKIVFLMSAEIIIRSLAVNLPRVQCANVKQKNGNEMPYILLIIILFTDQGSYTCT